MTQEAIQIHPGAKTWIYQADEELNAQQVEILKARLQAFLSQWQSHQQALTCYGSVVFNQFLVVMVDQRDVMASGCSMDTLTHFVQSAEREIGASLLNRNIVAFKDGEESEIKTMPLENLAQAYKDGLIHDETLVFDNLVDSAEKFNQHWLKPLKDSWHKRFL